MWAAVARPGNDARHHSNRTVAGRLTRSLDVIREAWPPMARYEDRGGRDMSTPKEDLTRLIQSQPDDSSPDEIVRELAFHVMIERGLADSDAGRTISNEEMGRRIRSWRK